MWGLWGEEPGEGNGGSGGKRVAGFLEINGYSFEQYLLTSCVLKNTTSS